MMDDQKEIEEARVFCTDKFEETTLVVAMDRGVVTAENFVEATLDVLVERDRGRLHARLEALTNPPRNLAPAGRTTKL